MLRIICGAASFLSHSYFVSSVGKHGGEAMIAKDVKNQGG